MRLCMQDRPAYVAWTAVHARGESCVSGSVSGSVSVSECECELRVSVSWVWCAAMPVDGPDRALTRPPRPAGAIGAGVSSPANRRRAHADGRR